MEQKSVDECSICLLPLVKGNPMFTTSCGHTFHFDCIKQSVEKSSDACPLCRAQLPYLANLFKPTQIPVQTEFVSLSTLQSNQFSSPREIMVVPSRTSSPPPFESPHILDKLIGNEGESLIQMGALQEAYNARHKITVGDVELCRIAYQLEVCKKHQEIVGRELDGFMNSLSNMASRQLNNNFKHRLGRSDFFKCKPRHICDPTKISDFGNLDVLLILNNIDEIPINVHDNTLRTTQTTYRLEINPNDYIDVMYHVGTAFRELMDRWAFASNTNSFKPSESPGDFDQCYGIDCITNQGLPFTIYPVFETVTGTFFGMATSAVSRWRVSDVGNFIRFTNIEIENKLNRMKQFHGIREIIRMCKIILYKEWNAVVHQKYSLRFCCVEQSIYTYITQLNLSEWKTMNLVTVVVNVFDRMLHHLKLVTVGIVDSFGPVRTDADIKSLFESHLKCFSVIFEPQLINYWRSSGCKVE